jgi:hypothetical protein
MGKIRVQDLAKMMGISSSDLNFKLKSIGVRVEGDDAHIDTDIITAILQGKKLSHPRDVILPKERRPKVPIQRIGQPRDAGENTPSRPDTERRKQELESVTNFRAFLCHASSDKPAVRNLYQRLLNDRIYPWLDEEELLPGQNWQHEIEKVLRRIPAVIVCLSRNSITKTGYVQKEILVALDILDQHPQGAIFLIPARLEECEVPERLQHLHYCDLYRDAGYNRLLLSLHFRASQLGVKL